MEKQEWLDNLKEGDEVAIAIWSYSTTNYSLSTVEKITPTGIIKTRQYTFNQKGIERGGNSTWGGKKQLVEVTKEIKDKIETEKILRQITKTKFADLPLEILKDISEVINRHAESKE